MGRGAGDGGPFGEGAGQVRRDRPANVDDFDPLVVERVEEVRRQLLPAAALVALQDHAEF